MLVSTGFLPVGISSNYRSKANVLLFKTGYNAITTPVIDSDIVNTLNGTFGVLTWKAWLYKIFSNLELISTKGKQKHSPY